MTELMLTVMIILLLMGFPMKMPLLSAAVLGFLIYLPNLSLQTVIQQMIGGVKPSALVAIPMFILAADIITRGLSADRLIDVVMRFMGHIRGGLAISVTAACALFGAVCGSTQATVVAIGGAMRPRMLKDGYKDSFTIGLIVNAADLAYLIPPSIGMIIYGVISGTSISELFIAGIGPGLSDCRPLLALFHVVRPQTPDSGSRPCKLDRATDRPAPGSLARGLPGDHHGRHLRRCLQPDGKLRQSVCSMLLFWKCLFSAPSASGIFPTSRCPQAPSHRLSLS